MSRLNNFDKIDVEYLLAPTDDLIIFWRSKVKGQGHSRPKYVMAKASTSTLQRRSLYSSSISFMLPVHLMCAINYFLLFYLLNTESVGCGNCRRAVTSCVSTTAIFWPTSITHTASGLASTWPGLIQRTAICLTTFSLRLCRQHTTPSEVCHRPVLRYTSPR